MSRDFAAMTALIVTKLQSAGTMDYSVSEVNYQITECLKEFSAFQPHIVPVTLQIESRYGTASASTTDSLADTVKTQFLQDDDANEKVVRNTTDKTWAVILSVAGTTANTGVVGISKDIFTVGENYRLYNQRCFNEKQLYIGGMPDYVEIDSVEYPLGQKRNFTILNDILELDVDSVADSNANTSLSTLADVDVLIRFNRPHVLTILPTYTGKLSATASAGATTLSGSALPAGTISIGDEFYIENLRNIYTVTSGTTVASNTGAFSIYPGLEVAIADTAASTIRFTKSTLSSQQEDIFADLCAARLAINKAPKLYSQANSCIAAIALATTAISNMTGMITAATANITLAGSATLAGTVDMAAATVAFAKIDAQIAAGTVVAASALVLLNTITVALGAQNDAMQQAAVDLNLAAGYMNEGLGYLREMQADNSLSDSYRALAVGNLGNANSYLSQATGDLREVSSRLSVAGGGRYIEAWGQSKLQETLSRLRRETKPKVSHRYPTE